MRNTPERFKSAQELFHAALSLEPADRTAFLVEACASDRELLDEVQSLISSHEQAASFIDSPKGIMKRLRRSLGFLFIFALPLIAAVPATAQSQRPATAAQVAVQVMEATIPELQKWMTEGKTTSKALVQAYLARIEAYNARGPRLNAIVAINPNALKEAEKLDQERATKGPRGPLHGIPIILKDNYDTADMPTTAGSPALVGFVPPDDGFQVRKLRGAGAVILAKSNMHELASGIINISAFGGQTRNPYDPDRNPGGSSGGTGAAIAASFAAAGMGSDTCGSIRIPASHNNLVGLRPTKGLSSIAGIVPLSTTQDVAGPLARTMADLAIVLDATIGEDPADPATKLAPGQMRPKFGEALDANALRGARLGTLTTLFGDAPEDQEVGRVVRAAIEEMKKQGATVVDIPIPNLNELLRDSSLIDFEFKGDLAAYLAERPAAPVRSLGEILQKGLYHTALESTFKRRNVAKGRDSAEYQKALEKRKQIQQVVLKVMDDQKLDALVYPTIRRKAARIGDPQAGSNCQLSASSGFPALSVPAGFTDDGLPVGIEIYGRPLADARVVALGYAYEKASPHRRPPARTPALGVKPIAFEITAAGGEMVPSVTTKSAAKARFTFNLTTNELTYAITISDLKPDDVLFANIHRAFKGQNGPVVMIVSNRSFKEISGAQMLSEPDRRSLMSGNLYLSIATRKNPAGELRAQLTVATSGR
ncbi:MAG: amidase family protein [Acidobacteriota bacterium]